MPTSYCTVSSLHTKEWFVCFVQIHYSTKCTTKLCSVAIGYVELSRVHVQLEYHKRLSIPNIKGIKREKGNHPEEGRKVSPLAQNSWAPTTSTSQEKSH